MGGLNNLAGIILCGGASRRMGHSKAMLPIGQSTMIEHMVLKLLELTDQIVVVKSPEQQLPALPGNVRIRNDAELFQGPLAGMAEGLAAIDGMAEFAFITAVDTPLLKLEIVEELYRRIAFSGDDIIMPSDQEFHFPLAAIYRIAQVLPKARELLSQGRKRPVFLMDDLNAMAVSMTELRAIDPNLESFENMNSRSDYRKIMERMNLNIPDEFRPRVVHVEFFGTPFLITKTKRVEIACDLYEDLIQSIEIRFPELRDKVIFKGKLHRAFRLVRNDNDFIDDFSLSPEPNDNIILMNADVGG